MWLIESDGDTFNGKRLWLRPGKRFILGRTLAETGGFAIANKTISRKHLVVEVGEVKPGDSARLETRSQIILEDLNTKIGTLVNGVQIRGRRHVLENNDYDIRLGQYEKLFRILWIPVVLTFSFTGKELRNNQISSFSELLEPLDIKVLVDYVRQSTTHVVARKRNTSKGLQALINGKYIVDHSFVDVIVKVTTADPGPESPLESHFDSSWPNELDHLPPKGPEQTGRPDSSYLPDNSRLAIFEGYTFVFYEKSQFDNLIAPITNGKGKALLHQVDPASTTSEEFVRYVKNVAGEKGTGEFEDGSNGAGVVVVRYQPLKGPTLPFYSDFGRQVSLQLDHRLIEQSEFLDAILNRDASVLRKPLEVEPSGAIPVSSSAGERIKTSKATEMLTAAKVNPTVIEAQTASTETENRRLAEATEPPLRRIGRPRRTVTSRFTGFDDEFADIHTDKSNEVVASTNKSPSSGASAMDYGKDVNVVEDDQVIVSDESRIRKKRSLSEIQESDNEDIMDQLAPAAAKLKRLRLAQEGSTKSPALSLPTVKAKALSQRPKEDVKKARKPSKGNGVPEFTYLHQRTEPSLENSERDAIEHTVEGVDATEVRNLAPIKEMAARCLDPTTRAGNAIGSDRWDEKWNGRMNFKKFRKRGDGRPTSIHKVIVSLEVAKNKDFGIGDSYWLKNDKISQLKKRDKSQKDVRNGSPIQSQVETVRENTTGLTSSSEQLQNLPTGSHSAQSTTKRPSTEVLINPAPVKKSKRDFQNDDSDDSDDGLGFKFRKRK